MIAPVMAFKESVTLFLISINDVNDVKRCIYQL